MCTPLRTATSTSSRWSRGPSPPTSPNPEVRMTAYGIPAAPQSSTTAATRGAATAITAMSAPPGISRTEGYAVSPATSAYRGCTGGCSCVRGGEGDGVVGGEAEHEAPALALGEAGGDRQADFEPVTGDVD